MKRMFKKTATIFSIALIFMMTILQSITVPTTVSAAELNQTGFVDSFSLEPTDLNHGQDTRVSVEFSDKSGNNMKAGDTLTLQVPENLEAFTTPIDLKDDSGQSFGTCEFPSTSQVVCTFNETVEELQNIRGNFFFTATAGAVEAGTTVDYETNLGTNLAKKGYSITSAAGGTEPGVFFYKTGDMQPSDPDHVRWFLNTNLKKEHLNSDIIIKDEIGTGQALVEDSFSITIEDHTGQSKTISKEEFIEQQYGEINITDTQNFEVTIYQSKASVTSFSIMYLTKVTEEGKLQEDFNNKFEVDYTVVNEEPVKDSGSHQVNNRFSGGGAGGDLPSAGTVRIVKMLDNNEALPLEGVTFNIFKSDGTPVENGQGVVTDAEGKVEIANLAPGDYYAQEISAPEYVDFDPNKKIEFTMESGATKGIELPINNDIKTTDISVTKVWEGKAKDSVTINLLADGEKVDSIDLSDANDWKHTFKDLPTVYDITDEEAIKYTVEEVEIDGYDVSITGNAKDGFTVTNTEIIPPTPIEPAKTKVSVEKVWEGKAQDSVTINLLADGEKVDSVELSKDNDWKHTFIDLPTVNDITDEEAIKYTVEEVEIDGYDVSITGNAKDGFTVTNTEIIPPTPIEPAKTKVSVEKVWEGKAQDSVTINLLADGEKIDSVELSKDNDWKHTFIDLPTVNDITDEEAIEYTVEEVEIDGYDVSITGSAKDGFTVTNTEIIPSTPIEPAKTKVSVEKVWEGKAQDSVTINLLADGEKVDSIDLSDANDWKHTFKDLPTVYDITDEEAIKYTVEEVEIAGYDVSITGDAKEGFTVTNTEKPEEPIVEDPESNDPEEPNEPKKPIKPTKPGKPEVEKEDPIKGEDGGQLPDTATNIFNLTLIGLGLMLVGLISLFVRRKRIE